MTKLNNWLSNKWNLIGIYALCSFCMGYILYDKLVLMELLLIYTLMSVSSLVVFILGVSRGMFLMYIERENVDNLMEKLMKIKEEEEE